MLATCSCDCCQAELRREEAASGDDRLQCVHAQSGLQPPSPFRAQPRSCDDLCHRSPAEQVLTAVKAAEMDTQRFCFFECAPRRLSDNEEPQPGGPCEPLAGSEADEVRDSSGNALPPMEQAFAGAHFLVSHAKSRAGADDALVAGVGAPSPAGAGGPAAEPWASINNPAPEKYAAITQAAIAAQKTAVETAEGPGAKIGELATRAANAISIAAAAVQDARRAALAAQKEELKVRTFRDVLRGWAHTQAFQLVPTMLSEIESRAHAEAKAEAKRKLEAEMKWMIEEAPKAGERAAAPYRAAMQNAAATAAEYARRGNEFSGQAKTLYMEAEALQRQANIQNSNGNAFNAQKLMKKAHILAKKAISMNSQASSYFKTAKSISDINVPEYAREAAQAAYHAEVMVNPDSAQPLPPIA